MGGWFGGKKVQIFVEKEKGYLVVPIPHSFHTPQGQKGGRRGEHCSMFTVPPNTCRRLPRPLYTQYQSEDQTGIGFYCPVPIKDQTGLPSTNHRSDRQFVICGLCEKAPSLSTPHDGTDKQTNSTCLGPRNICESIVQLPSLFERIRTSSSRWNGASYTMI